MWPWLLGSAGLGAALGGIGAYQQSGGQLGPTVQGALGGGLAGAATAGLGGLAGGAATRMAGQALGPLAGGSSLAALKAAQELPVIGQFLPKATTLAEQAGLGSTIVGAAKAAPKIAGIGANVATQALTAPIAGALGAGITGLAGQAVGGAGRAAAAATGGAAAMGAGRPGVPGVYPSAQYALPSNLGGQFGPEAPYGTTADVINPFGYAAGRRLEEELEQDVNIRGMQKEAAALAPIAEQAKKAEFLRQMAAAGIRSNIATQAAMLRQAQLGAQQMGQTAAQQMGQALTSQYQYS